MIRTSDGLKLTVMQGPILMNLEKNSLSSIPSLLSNILTLTKTLLSSAGLLSYRAKGWLKRLTLELLNPQMIPIIAQDRLMVASQQ
jgi:hypothetical protein